MQPFFWVEILDHRKSFIISVLRKSAKIVICRIMKIDISYLVVTPKLIVVEI